MPVAGLLLGGFRSISLLMEPPCCPVTSSARRRPKARRKGRHLPLSVQEPGPQNCCKLDREKLRLHGSGACLGRSTLLSSSELDALPDCASKISSSLSRLQGLPARAHLLPLSARDSLWKTPVFVVAPVRKKWQRPPISAQAHLHEDF